MGSCVYNNSIRVRTTGCTKICIIIIPEMDTRLMDMPHTRSNQRYEPTMPMQRLQMLHHARLALQEMHGSSFPEQVTAKSQKQRTTHVRSKLNVTKGNKSTWLQPYNSVNPGYPDARSIIDKPYPNTPYSTRYDFYDDDGIFEAKKTKRRGKNVPRVPIKDGVATVDAKVIPKTSMPTKQQQLRKSYWFDDKKRVKAKAPIGAKGTFFGLPNK